MTRDTLEWRVARALYEANYKQVDEPIKERMKRWDEDKCPEWQYKGYYKLAEAAVLEMRK